MRRSGRQLNQVFDGKVDELVKLLMTMQSLVVSTDAAFVLASAAISELRTSVKKVDVKVGVSQHACDASVDEIVLLHQKVDEKFGAISEFRTALKKMDVNVGVV